MKKICIDARMIENAGIGTYLKSLILNLNEKFFNTEDCENENLNLKNFKFYLIVHSKIKKSKFFDQKKNILNSKNFELIFLDAPIYSIKEQILLPFKIPKCDLFLSPHFNVAILPNRAKKSMVTIHDVYHLAYFKNLRFTEKIYAKFFISKAVLQSDKSLTVSNFSKEQILKYTKANPDKIEVIYNALNPIFLKKKKEHKDFEKDKSNKDCQKKNIEEEMKKTKYDYLKLPKYYFLFVGSLKAHKNLINLIKAYNDLEKEYPEIELIIIGKNKNLRNSIDIFEILNKNKNLKNKIKIISDLKDEDLPFIYKNAISLVIPSFYEGFGYPPLEAMSQRCPVIASNRASIPEVCQDAAIYIEPKDYITILNAMKKIIEDKNLRKDLIQKGLKRVEYFTNEKFIEKHISQIIKLL